MPTGRRLKSTPRTESTCDTQVEKGEQGLPESHNGKRRPSRDRQCIKGRGADCCFYWLPKRRGKKRKKSVTESGGRGKPWGTHVTILSGHPRRVAGGGKKNTKEKRKIRLNNTKSSRSLGVETISRVGGRLGGKGLYT